MPCGPGYLGQRVPLSVTAGLARAALTGLLVSMGMAISHSSESPVVAVQLTRQHVVDMLRKAGLPEVADDAQRELPDPVDSEQVAVWAVPYGINMGELMDRMGGSL
jgi:hypothetical protein